MTASANKDYLLPFPPPRFLRLLDRLVSLQHGHAVHHGGDGLADLRADQFADADRPARPRARVAADRFAARRRPARRRHGSAQTHDVHPDRPVLRLDHLGAAHLFRPGVAAYALRRDHAAGDLHFAGTTVAPIDDSQSGAARSFGPSVGAARHATLCADHRRTVASPAWFSPSPGPPPVMPSMPAPGWRCSRPCECSAPRSPKAAAGRASRSPRCAKAGASSGRTA